MNADRPVLVTTDGSAHSHRVVPHAALLASALNTRVLLLSILDDSEGGAGRVEAELRGTLSRLGIDGDVLASPPRQREGTPAAILRVAAERAAAIVALDSRGHGALGHVLHGSVMQDVLRKADRPLLVSGPNLEPPPARAEPYRIVVTNDGSRAAKAALTALAPLLTGRGFEVTLLRIHEREPGGRDDAAAMAACERELAHARELLPASLKVATQVREIPRAAGVDTAIIEKALEVNAQAIAMSTHGLSARAHVMMGSVASTMLGRSPLPLILVKAEV